MSRGLPLVMTLHTLCGFERGDDGTRDTTREALRWCHVVGTDGRRTGASFSDEDHRTKFLDGRSSLREVLTVAPPSGCDLLLLSLQLSAGHDRP